MFCPPQLKLRQLQKKKQEEAAGQSSNTEQSKLSPAQSRIQKDFNEIDLPPTMTLKCLDATNMNMEVTLTPDEGYYKGGRFTFSIQVNHNYPIEPPKVKCLQKIYHPNIDLEGNICLNILREEWTPVLPLNAVLVGLNFLFLDPNPVDPLNKESANVLLKDKNLFAKYVRASMTGGQFEGVRYDYVMKH